VRLLVLRPHLSRRVWQWVFSFANQDGNQVKIAQLTSGDAVFVQLVGGDVIAVETLQCWLPSGGERIWSIPLCRRY